jgi:uncharacterized protein
MKELEFSKVYVRGGFWGAIIKMMSGATVYSQWEQLELTGRIDNFRLIAGSREGFRTGFFYNDSDVHKWAEAASYLYRLYPKRKLGKLLDSYVEIMRAAQDEDGYLFTYNQFYFPGNRWVNLQIEHELYTLGHLIEAGIAHRAGTGDTRLYDAAVKSADVIVRDFNSSPPIMTPGHPEIEIALTRLFQASGDHRYLNMAKEFIRRRGTASFFGIRLILQFLSQSKRESIIQKKKETATGAGALSGIDFSENLLKEEPPFIKLRSNVNFLSGRYFQQHKPVHKMKIPVGHSVRWCYLMTAAAMVCRLENDGVMLKAMKSSWDRMVRRRMYVTGGIGSLPVIEGFGRDYELDNRYAYCETCAAISCIFWNWQMLLLTGDAEYADCIEWQLYNAVLPGFALDGHSYLYRNPLESAGGITRKAWYQTACCPSNILRLIATLGKYAFSQEGDDLYVHQYLSCSTVIIAGRQMQNVSVRMRSGMPWNGSNIIEITTSKPVRFRLFLRIPSWSESTVIRLNKETRIPGAEKKPDAGTAGGYSPFSASYYCIEKTWKGKNEVSIDFSMDIKQRSSYHSVLNNRNRVAVTRGPLVYCLESIDNPGIKIPGAVLNRHTSLELSGTVAELNNCRTIIGMDKEGRSLTFIPYFTWSNRGNSCMQVWVETMPG